MIINQPFQLNQEVLRTQLHNMQETIASAPQHVLDQVRHAQQIEAHNAAVDEAKAKKRHLRNMAAQAGLPVDVLKRMVSSVQRVK